MRRKDEWQQAVRAIIDTLCNSNDSAGREVGRIWQWAFEQVTQKEQWLRIQDPATQRDLLAEFLRTNERKAQKLPASDHSLAEKTAQAGFDLTDLPPACKPSQEVTAALSAFGMFFGHEKHNVIDSLVRLPYTCALFDLPPQILADIFQTKRLTEPEQEVLHRVAACLPADKEQRNYFRRLEAAAILQGQFRFSHELITSTDVYRRGHKFYKDASRDGPGVTLTISNTSGLWNPYERFGTAKASQLYGLKEIAGLPLKDAFREANFSDGILNPAHACRRIYLFNSASIWEAFGQARAAAADRRKFDEVAQGLLAEVCSRMSSAVGTLHLVAVRDFDTCAALPIATRISAKTLMFSNRSSTLAITHAFWCNLESEGCLEPLAKILETTADLVSDGTLKLLEPLRDLLAGMYGAVDVATCTQDFLAPEILRRGLNAEPHAIIGALRTQFKLDAEYLTPEMLKAELANHLND